MSDVTDLIHFRIDEVRASRCSGEDDGPNLKRLGRAVVTHADTILAALASIKQTDAVEAGEPCHAPDDAWCPVCETGRMRGAK